MKAHGIRMALMALLLVLGTAAEARTLYWTGQAQIDIYSSTNPNWDCFVAATQEADTGVRQSCIYDYNIQPETCWSAPVVNTVKLGRQRYSDFVTCSVRVFIQVP